jgi:hypothetical protein
MTITSENIIYISREGTAFELRLDRSKYRSCISHGVPSHSSTCAVHIEMINHRIQIVKALSARHKFYAMQRSIARLSLAYMDGEKA